MERNEILWFGDDEDDRRRRRARGRHRGRGRRGRGRRGRGRRRRRRGRGRGRGRRGRGRGRGRRGRGLGRRGRGRRRGRRRRGRRGRRRGRVSASVPVPLLPRPAWIRAKAPQGPAYERLRGLMRGLELHTVCEEAHCPNLGECWSRGTATFMILGEVCTRACGFCAVKTGLPGRPPDPDEPRRVADAVAPHGAAPRGRHVRQPRRPAGRGRRDLRGHHRARSAPGCRAARSRC